MMFTPDVDYVYIPNNREQGNQTRLREFLGNITMLASIQMSSDCFNALSRALCVHYYLPCGSNGTIHVPQFLCPEVCDYIVNDVCRELWGNLLKFESEISRSSARGLDLPVCNDTSQIIDYLDLSVNCCSNAEVVVPSISPDKTSIALQTNVISTSTTSTSSSNAASAPPSNAASAPPSNAASAPPSNAASAPPSNAASAPPSNAASAPPSNAASAPPSNAASDPPSNAASDPPSNAASVPLAATTVLYISTSVAVGCFLLLIGISAVIPILLILRKRRKTRLQHKDANERYLQYACNMRFFNFSLLIIVQILLKLQIVRDNNIYCYTCRLHFSR